MRKWNRSTTSTLAFWASNFWYLAHHFHGTLSISSAISWDGAEVIEEPLGLLLLAHAGGVNADALVQRLLHAEKLLEFVLGRSLMRDYSRPANFDRKTCEVRPKPQMRPVRDQSRFRSEGDKWNPVACYLSHGTGRHHWHRLRRVDRGDLHRARQSRAAGAHRHQPGGLLTTTSIVENFPGFPEGVDGFELMQNLQKQAERFGARVQFGNLDSVDFSGHPLKLVVDGEPLESRTTVIVATGSSPRSMGLPSEEALEKLGVTYCATCDGALPQFRNQPLVVVGGGDSALEEATYLTRFASQVYLVHRRDSFRASVIMQERALKNPRSSQVWNSVVTEVLDVAQKKVTGVKLKNIVTGETSTLPCAGVFVAIGHVPNVDGLRRPARADAGGYIKLHGGTRTNVPGVFAAGDVADSVYRQAITAAGTGCAAAIEAERFLEMMESP